MRDFFKGWRRKIGVATLVMACVFTAGWIRSFAISDFLRMDCPKFRLMAESTRGWIECDHIPELVEPGEWDFEFYSGYPRPEWGPPLKKVPMWVSTGWWTTYDEKGNEIGGTGHKATSHYAAIVVPLIIVSAWLLLRSPRHVATPEPSPSPGSNHA